MLKDIVSRGPLTWPDYKGLLQDLTLCIHHSAKLVKNLTAVSVICAVKIKSACALGPVACSYQRRQHVVLVELSLQLGKMCS